MRHEKTELLTMSPHYEPLRLEQLRDAMSPETVLEVLRRDWEYPMRRGLTLMDCQIIRAFPWEGQYFVLEYEMRFLGENGEKIERFFGELVGEEAKSRHERIVKKMRKTNLPGAASTDLASYFPELGLVLRSFDSDWRLPGLELALNSGAMQPILSRHLSLDDSEMTNCATDILSHRLGKRCVFRFRFDSLNPETGKRIPRSVIGKISKFRDDSGSRVFSEMQDLWEMNFSDRAGDGIRIPKPLAYLPDWKLLIMEDVPGASLPDIEETKIAPAVAMGARTLAKLHRCPLEVPRRFGVDDELELLGRWVGVVSQVIPGLKISIEDALRKVQVGLEQSRSFEPTLVHRDFYEDQILVDGSQSILIDFDTLCVSDPAIDVGNFLAHLKLAGLQRLGNVSTLEEVFLSAYNSSGSQNFLSRIEAYTDSTLLRLACIYSLRPQWSHLAGPLLGNLT